MKNKILVIPNDPFYEYLGKDHVFLEKYFNPLLMFECHIVSFEDNYRYPDKMMNTLVIHPFREKQFGRTVFYPWRFVRVLSRFFLRTARLARIVRKERINLVRGYGINYLTLVGLLASRITSRPYVLSLHNDYDYMFSFSGKLKAQLKHLMERAIIAGATCVTASYPFLKEYAVRHGASNAIFIHNPMGLDAFLKVGEKRTASEGEEKVFLFAGRFFDPQKNFLRLIKAYSLVNRELRRNTRLLVLGSGGDKVNYFKAKAKDYGIEENIDFVGTVKRTEMPGWYAKADFFVFPSLYEALPKALSEAMAAGLPVLTSHHPSCSYLASAKNGVLVNPLDAADIRKGMEKMLRLERDEYMEKVKNSFKKASEFDDENVYRQVAALYERLIGK